MKTRRTLSRNDQGLLLGHVHDRHGQCSWTWTYMGFLPLEVEARWKFCVSSAWHSRKLQVNKMLLLDIGTLVNLQQGPEPVKHDR